ncbi:uncharacterized protein LOC110437620 [Sorghum bicolor]|uniref:uncharacterized protein LOC110437620 n=1 Tax=Sorghum bicolor TaxID=4558 RepID=UPI000B424DAB|nr:uncharacterized protein LOC110437620 [Sorghum bicolor]|eukprot:XP_021321783.1 uncharacterized protein LOC110437620 [Sorghum bicolor]
MARLPGSRPPWREREMQQHGSLRDAHMTSGGREEPVNVLAGEAAVTAVGCVGAAMGHAGRNPRGRPSLLTRRRPSPDLLSRHDTGAATTWPHGVLALTRSSSQLLPSCRPCEVLKGAPDLWRRGPAVSLHRTCGRVRRSGARSAAELRWHVQDDSGMAACSRPTHPASPTSDLWRSWILGKMWIQNKIKKGITHYKKSI